VEVTHVLGHRGHPENEACDRMAVAAYKALMSSGIPGTSR
jgi:ribonuclease HI